MTIKGNWSSGENYDNYMGRWSSLVAYQFVPWVNAEKDLDWLDLGCGTGQLSEAIFEIAKPNKVVGIDQSAGFLQLAQEKLKAFKFRCEHGNATQLAQPNSTFDVAVSGLCINFLSNSEKGIQEMYRVVKPGGKVGIYVWDYSGKMEFVRLFWDAVQEVDKGSKRFDEGKNASICRPHELESIFLRIGLESIDVAEINIDMRFSSFDNYWLPFFYGQGMLGKYLLSQSQNNQIRLKHSLESRIHKKDDGSFNLKARAWCIMGKK